MLSIINIYNSKFLNLNEFVITETEEKRIATAAITGERSMHLKGT